MIQYEFATEVITTYISPQAEKLDQWGREGWRIVGVLDRPNFFGTGQHGVCFYFQREKK